MNSFELLSKQDHKEPEQEDLKSRCDTNVFDLRREALNICTEADKANKAKSKVRRKISLANRSKRRLIDKRKEERNSAPVIWLNSTTVYHKLLG